MNTTNKRGGQCGPALKALRQAAGMTLDDVSAAAGVSVSYISRAENDLVTPTPGWVAMVSIAIGDHLATTKAKPKAAALTG